MDHFIRYYDESLDKETCRQIISRFDADPRQISGRVSGNAGPELDRAAKQTNELILPDDAVWSDLKRALQQSMSVGLGKYQRDVKFLAGSDHKSLYAEPLRIKKYDIGGQFSWHIDCNSAQNHSRCLAVQWYFNDVSEGGATEFEDQKTAIACREGRLAFFPVSWTYRHRGAPPLSGPKYVCTTFIHPRF
ncbi:MAG TPA: 2OG-Fe(II) oxygenase [Aestuariivirgaceae bacterium]|nr:2OG-Fe(II) oxygenase [Aestuariivirgaceae bacterium]